jgi:hypothetical protein
MRPQVNINNLPRFVYNSPARGVRNWEDPLIHLNPFGRNVLSETISHLLGDKDNLSFLTALGTSEG